MRISIAILFIINLWVRIFIQGLLPIYAVIATNLGASKQYTGTLLSVLYLMMLLGTWLGGKLGSSMMSLKRLFIWSLLPFGISLCLMGIVTSLTLLVTFSIILFLSTGFNITFNSILLGKYSSFKTIGSNYGILGISNLLGTLIGGLIVGPTIFHFGYFNGFISFGCVFFIISGLSFYIKKPVETSVDTKDNPLDHFKFTRSFAFLFVAEVMAISLVFIFLLAFGLSLKQANYNIQDISLLYSVGTLFVLPLPYLLGKLSAKYNANRLLCIIYLLMVLSLVLLLLPKSYMVLVIAIAFMSVLAYASRPVAMSLIFPWFNEKSLPMAQAYLGVAASLAGILGYLATGMSLEHFGFVNTMLFGIIVGAFSIIILLMGVSKKAGIQ